MPLEAQVTLKVHASDARGPRHTPVGQDHVGKGDEQREAPHQHRQQFAVAYGLDERRQERLHDLVIPVEADEPEEHDADIHVDVEEHGRDPAHEDVELRGAQARVPQDLERKSQAHQEVSHDNVLEIDDETLGAGHVEEHPPRHAVEQDAGHEDHEVERGDDLLGDEGVGGAGPPCRWGAGGIHGLATSEGAACKVM